MERELRRLEREAERATAASSGQFFNRAGDICHSAGKSDRALFYYGRAIDAHLDAGRFDAAGAVCRKILRISPGVVRARCTLAWLSIGKELDQEAAHDVREYVRAASAADQALVAREQLRLMAAAAPSAAVRELVAELLAELGDPDPESALAEAERAADAEAHWARVLRAALMGPDELRQRARSRAEG